MNKIKFLLCFALLVSGVEGHGQIYINSYRFAVGTQLLLDAYPNAAGAYSLRKLREAYTGNCIEVRRASDNTTSNIAFVSNYLDTASLKTFCSATDCFVRTWYDQSGNTRNATQTTNANQPLIVTSGVIEYLNGLPCININSTTAGLAIGTSIAISSETSIFIYARPDTTTATTAAGLVNYNSSPVDDPELRFFSGAGRDFALYYNGGYAIQQSVNISNGILASYFLDSNGKSDLYRNNVASFTGTRAGALSAAANELSIGRYANSTRRGKISEFVIYLTNQISSVNGINTNINNFYSIY